MRFLINALMLVPIYVNAAEEMTGESILFWSPEQQITGYRSIDEIYPTRNIPAGKFPFPLIPDHRDFKEFRYTHNQKSLGIEEFMGEMNTAGLIVVKNSRVLLERYALGNNENSRWISFSVAKSVVSMLIGAAIKDGYITSIDDKVVDYLPLLKGGAYADVSVKNILQMASGVAWNEDYTDLESDVVRSPGGTLPLIKYLGALPRKAQPDTIFNYNTGETNLAGALLRAAIGNNLATYLAKKIWQPFGMEADANWLIEEPDGVEFGGCCINATLRDYARLGIFALRNGQLPNGEETLPANWMRDSTAPSNGSKRYGYYWWLQPDGGTTGYAAEGVYGQIIWIDPETRTVIAMHSAWPVAWDDAHDEHLWKFVRELAGHLKDMQ